jgi:hypothetical protein
MEQVPEGVRADTEKFLDEVRSDAEKFLDTVAQVPGRATEVAHDAQEQAKTSYRKVLDSIK